MVPCPGGTIVAGSTKIGKYCQIGGASVLNGHITIADGVAITGMGMVMRSIEEKACTHQVFHCKPTESGARRRLRFSH